MSAAEVLALSEKMTYGYKMDIFVLYLSFIGWYILGVLTFYIAELYYLPYLNMTLTELYFYLKESYTAKNSPSPNEAAVILDNLAQQAAIERENTSSAELPLITTEPDHNQANPPEIDEYSKESSV